MVEALLLPHPRRTGPQQLFLSKTRADAIEYHKKNWGADFPSQFPADVSRREIRPDAWQVFRREPDAQYVVMTRSTARVLRVWTLQITIDNANEVADPIAKRYQGDLIIRSRQHMPDGFLSQTQLTFRTRVNPGRDWVDYMTKLDQSVSRLIPFPNSLGRT